MVRNITSQCHAADDDPPQSQDLGQDITMADAAGDSAPHGGQEQDDQPDQGPPPNPDTPGPGDQEGQQPQEPADNNAMQGDVPCKIIKRQECRYLLKRIGLSPEAAQAIVQDHGYDTAKKLSCLKLDDVDVLIKTLCTPGT